MHRVFRGQTGVLDQVAPLAVLRADLRALGLEECPVGLAFEYHARRRRGDDALFATLHQQGSAATIYLYPDALGGPPGIATSFYRRLEEAGFGMGSKLGPSISLDPEDTAQRSLFIRGLREVLRAALAVD